MSLRGRVAVLGAGRAGCALYAGLRAKNHRVSLLWTRSEATAQAARAEGFPAHAGPLPPSLRDADLVFLAVSDGAVAGLAAAIANTGLVRPGSVYAHLAGSLDLAPLRPLAGAASLGSLHPLVSIAGRRASLAGAACAVEASDVKAASRLEAVAKDLGLTVIRPTGDRARYHAAACLVGNYPQVLMESALRLLAGSGLSRDEARRALGPLLLAAARNAVDHDGAASLSGPVARGDVDVVRRHLAALRADSTLGRVDGLYRAAAAMAASLMDGPGEPAMQQLLSDRP